jgi:ubiquinone/menaquinone biosynthesis C-methylase UbiE
MMTQILPPQTMDKSITEPVKNHDQWGTHDYAQVHGLTGPPAIALVEMVQSLSPLDREGTTVLELGCGTGILTCELVRRCPGIEVVATNLSEGMVRKAEQAVRKLEGSERVEVMKADAHHLGEVVKSCGGEGGAFTHVLSTATIQFCAEPGRVLREVREVLRKAKEQGQEGIFGVSSWTNLDLERYYEVVYRDLGISELFKPWIDPMHWPSDEEGVKRILEKAGFRDVRTKEITIPQGYKEEHSLAWLWEFPNPVLVALRTTAVEKFGVERCKEVGRQVWRERKIDKGPEECTVGQILGVGFV